MVETMCNNHGVANKGDLWTVGLLSLYGSRVAIAQFYTFSVGSNCSRALNSPTVLAPSYTSRPTNRTRSKNAHTIFLLQTRRLDVLRVAASKSRISGPRDASTC